MIYELNLSTFLFLHTVDLRNEIHYYNLFRNCNPSFVSCSSNNLKTNLKFSRSLPVDNDLTSYLNFKYFKPILYIHNV